ncbi:site-specific recombinase XerD [Paracoccus versutus]|uniref:Site-specific recombinase XerD n=1 Tax=Paracoccus versutus TaxID=34007 RepID=A0AAQ0HEZ9_PARVE|nr:site-specific integrase [Paracoccus versutus]REG35234.1 site-specific recombinase XerD [Paracoccus versutus]
MARPQIAAAPKHPPASRRREDEPLADVVTWDGELPALGLRNRFGKESWIVQARIDGRNTRRTLGTASSLTREAARQAATAVLDALRAERAETATSPDTTVATFAERWLADCAGQWKPSTLVGHRYGIKGHILPQLGEKPVAALTAEDVADWFAALPRSPGGRNRVLAVLSGMMRHAELLGLRAPGSNPCAGMRRKKSGFTATVLCARDYARLGRALDAREKRAPMLVALIRFLALTGCRRGEATALRWDWIDGPRAALPDAKAGPRSIWLGTPALDLLASLPRTGDLVFGQDDRPVNTASLATLWREIRIEIRMPTLRLHDLRHSFATTAVSAGEPLRTVAGLLGHSDLAITEGYTQLADDTLRRAAASVGKHLNDTLTRKGRQPAKLVKASRPAKPPASSPAIPPHLLREYKRSRLLIPAFCEKYGLDPKLFWKAVKADLARIRKEACK